MMEKISISFAIIVLLLGLLIGAVTGSLLHQIFGLEILNRSLLEHPVPVAENFYVFSRLELQLTPAGLLGFVAAAYLLYKKGKG